MEQQPRPNRKEMKRNARKKRYLNEALKLITELGPDALTIANLAERMKASNGAIYRYFPSKEALVVELQTRAIETLGDFLEEELKKAEEATDPALSPAAKSLILVGVAFMAYARHAEKHPHNYHLIDVFFSAQQEFLSTQEALRIASGSINPILRRVQGLLIAATKEGAIDEDDVEQMALIMWALVHGLEHFKKTDRVRPKENQVPTIVHTSRRCFFKALGAKKELIAEVEAAGAQIFGSAEVE